MSTSRNDGGGGHGGGKHLNPHEVAHARRKKKRHYRANSGDNRRGTPQDTQAGGDGMEWSREEDHNQQPTDNTSFQQHQYQHDQQYGQQPNYYSQQPNYENQANAGERSQFPAYEDPTHLAPPQPAYQRQTRRRSGGGGNSTADTVHAFHAEEQKRREQQQEYQNQDTEMSSLARGVSEGYKRMREDSKRRGIAALRAAGSW